VEVKMLPINSWTINIILGIILSIIAGGGYLVWKNSVEDSVLMQVKIQQLEQQIKDHEKTISDLEATNKEGIEIIADLKNKEIDLNQKLRDLESYLSTHKDDKESSEVLKRTFKELSQ